MVPQPAPKHHGRRCGNGQRGEWVPGPPGRQLGPNGPRSPPIGGSGPARRANCARRARFSVGALAGWNRVAAGRLVAASGRWARNVRGV